MSYSDVNEGQVGAPPPYPAGQAGAPPNGQPGVPVGYYPYGAPIQKPPANGLAIASMVLGIIWLWGVGSILALIFGYRAKRQIRQSNGTEGGGGMATAGIVLGWVGTCGVVAMILLIGVVAALGGKTATQFVPDSCATEKQTITAASEAFYAQNGQYPADTSALVTAGLLRTVPQDYEIAGSAGLVVPIPNNPGLCS